MAHRHTSVSPDGARLRLVVVGNGMAALRFLERLASLAPRAYHVTVIGAEPEPAYNRVLLSALLAGDSTMADVQLRGRDWYAAQGFTLVTGVAVAQVSAVYRQVCLSDGRRIGFDRLVLATGSEPIMLPVPGADCDGVMTFRTTADVAAMQRLRPGARAIVIGGGLLGLETAYGLRRRGCVVTLVHLMDRLMERQLDSEAAMMLLKAVEAQGIAVALTAQTSEIVHENGAVAAVRLSDGRVMPADCVVMSVGITPCVSLARAAGIAVGRGILVDDQLETDQPGIHALGECAEHWGRTYGLVAPLYEQADVLARVLDGQCAAFAPQSLATNLKVSGLAVFSAGAYDDVAGAERLYYRDPARGIYKKLQVERGADGHQRLIGAVLIGCRRDGPWYADLIATGQPVQRFRSTLLFGQDLAARAA